MYYIGTVIVTLYKSKHFFIFFSSFLHFSLCMFSIAVGGSQFKTKGFVMTFGNVIINWITLNAQQLIIKYYDKGICWLNTKLMGIFFPDLG